jgi:hypothetical protein
MRHATPTPKSEQKERGYLLQKLVFDTYSVNDEGLTILFVDLTTFPNQ